METKADWRLRAKLGSSAIAGAFIAIIALLSIIPREIIGMDSAIPILVFVLQFSALYVVAVFASTIFD